MRGEDDIHKAHDILWAFLAGEVKNVEMDDQTRLGLRSALDTLCWVLEHTHIQTFAANLERLERYVEAHGGSFKRVN